MVDKAVAPVGGLAVRDLVVQAATLESCNPDDDSEFPRVLDFRPGSPPVPPLPPPVDND